MNIVAHVGSKDSSRWHMASGLIYVCVCVCVSVSN